MECCCRLDGPESLTNSRTESGLTETSGNADQKQPIKVREPEPATCPTSEHHHLMPQCYILRLKLAFYLEWRAQDDQDKP
jgi:hypothetical protein